MDGIFCLRVHRGGHRRVSRAPSARSWRASCSASSNQFVTDYVNQNAVIIIALVLLIVSLMIRPSGVLHEAIREARLMKR